TCQKAAILHFLLRTKNCANIPDYFKFQNRRFCHSKVPILRCKTGSFIFLLV
ncbi:hypothetical protein HMPREF0653_01684, partial [Prevotella disiens JCM 6334 = ATCC 29426]